MTMAFRLSSKMALEVSESPIFPPAFIETLCAVMLVALETELTSRMLFLASRKTLAFPALMLPIRIWSPLKTPRFALLVVKVVDCPMVTEPWDSRTIDPGPEVRIRSSMTRGELLERVISPLPL
jgi:hypothetical protein